MRVTGQTILISGGGSGIGLALARALSRENTVIAAGRDRARLDRARDELPGVRTVRMDVTDPDSIRAALEWIEREFGKLTILINNAGVLLPSDGADGLEGSRREIEVNLLGSVQLTQLALPLLERAPEAAIVFTSSAVAYVAAPGTPVYAATKAGLTSYSRSLRQALAGSAIRVFAVHPPLVDTEAVGELAGRKIEPAAVADAVLEALRGDRFESGVGPAKRLRALSRLAPSLADRVVARNLAADS